LRGSFLPPKYLPDLCLSKARTRTGLDTSVDACGRLEKGRILWADTEGDLAAKAAALRE
jgi:hypothetical protein